MDRWAACIDWLVQVEVIARRDYFHGSTGPTFAGEVMQYTHTHMHLLKKE